MATLKEIRNETLRKAGFIAVERRDALDGNIVFSHSAWFYGVIKERAKEYREMQDIARNNKWTQNEFNKEWVNFVVQKYRDNKWTLVRGRLDFWQMFRAKRAKAIQQGKWDETPKKRGSHRRTIQTEGGKVRIDKGNVKRQKTRYNEKRRKAGA